MVFSWPHPEDAVWQKEGSGLSGSDPPGSINDCRICPLEEPGKTWSTASVTIKIKWDSLGGHEVHLSYHKGHMRWHMCIPSHLQMVSVWLSGNPKWRDTPNISDMSTQSLRLAHRVTMVTASSPEDVGNNPGELESETCSCSTGQPLTVMNYLHFCGTKENIS